MKVKQLIKLYLLAAFFMMVQPVLLTAQNLYVINDSKSSISVSGTSTMHDWTMSLDNFECNVDAVISDDYKLIIHSISFKGESESLSSDNSLMTSKAHDALKVKRHSSINYRFSSLNEIAIQGGTVEGKVNGNISIAGVEKDMVLPFSGEIDTDYGVSLSGVFNLKMSDFSIKPPTALLGAIRTGDEVKVEYTLYFDGDNF